MNLLNDYPYVQNILFIWSKTLVPFALAILLFYLNRREILSAKTIFVFFVGFVVYVFVIAGLKSWAQYDLWHQSEAARFLLPPHQPTYFYSYVFFRFFLGWLVGLLFAFAFGFLLFIMLRYSRGRMVTKEEVLLGTLLAFLVGWPNSLLFVPLVFLGMSLWSVVTKMMSKLKPDFSVSPFTPITPFLFGTAIFLLAASLLIPNALFDLFHISVFKIST